MDDLGDSVEQNEMTSLGGRMGNDSSRNRKPIVHFRKEEMWRKRGKMEERWCAGRLGVAPSLLSGCSAWPSEEHHPGGQTHAAFALRYLLFLSKARYLGEVHGRNLEQLMDKITQGRWTTPVCQCRSIAQHGIFTMPTVNLSQRYLEVILGMPDILDELRHQCQCEHSFLNMVEMS
jgi:hypothetical protein